MNNLKSKYYKEIQNRMFPDPIKATESITQYFLDELTRLEAEKQRAVEEARSFIKNLIYQNGGSIVIEPNVAFLPHKWEIVREQLVGEFKEVMRLEPKSQEKTQGEEV